MKRNTTALFARGACAAVLLLAATGSRAAIADYQGSYEALLISGSGLNAVPAAKLEVKATKTGAFTGKLFTADKKIYNLKGSLKEEDGAAVIARRRTPRRTPCRSPAAKISRPTHCV